MWGTTGIGVNVGKVAEVLGDNAPIGSLALIFDPENMEKLAACGVQFIDAPAELIPAALTYLGEDPDSQDPDVIAKTEAVLAAVAPFVQKFHNQWTGKRRYLCGVWLVRRHPAGPRSC